MTHPWRSDDWADDELEELFAERRETWRGDLHFEPEPWGDDTLADWPENSAGPEYWMYKRAAEGW